VADAGKAFNTNSFRVETERDQIKIECMSCFFCFVECPYPLACHCLPCIVGNIMNKSTGMNYWLACCCMGSNICAARNIVRYHYRIEEKKFLECYQFFQFAEIKDECCIPFLVFIISITIGIHPLFVWTHCYAYQFVAPILFDTRMQSSNTTKRYLVGFEQYPPLQAATQSQQQQQQQQEILYAYAIQSNEQQQLQQQSQQHELQFQFQSNVPQQQQNNGYEQQGYAQATAHVIGYAVVN
jgi:hypothetical protein